jgi:hypothetical protein
LIWIPGKSLEWCGYFWKVSRSLCFHSLLGMTDWINNLRKLAWCQKHQPYPGVSLLSSQRKFTRTGDSFIKTVSLKSARIWLK